MSKTILMLSASALLLGACATTQPDGSTVVTEPSAGAGVGVVGGAATGAALGGPVGAVVGAVVGGVAGAAVDPPAEVRTYIAGQTVPPVTYNGQIAVGQTLPETITMYDVPQYERYRWSYVNNRRVLIDRSTRQIVAVLDDPHAGHSMGAHTTTQSTVVTQKPSAGAGVGVVSGAATGAALGGPVGAVIGAVVGGVAGAAVDPPAEVRTYITGQNVPPVTYSGQIAVGQVLPSTVTMYDIPRYERYRWAYLNNQRVLIDRSNNRIVAVLAN